MVSGEFFPHLHSASGGRFGSKFTALLGVFFSCVAVSVFVFEKAFVLASSSVFLCYPAGRCSYKYSYKYSYK